MIVSLIGMPGCGKTTLGSYISKIFKIPFLDLDKFIEEHEGISISVLFDKYGEAYFRKKETFYLEKILSGKSKEDFVLATGGGTPCFNNNLSLLKQKTLTIFIDLPLNKLKERLQRNKCNRPLFAGMQELSKKVDVLYQERKYYYNQAEIYWFSEDQKISKLLHTLHIKLNLLPWIPEGFRKKFIFLWKVYSGEQRYKFYNCALFKLSENTSRNAIIDLMMYLNGESKSFVENELNNILNKPPNVTLLKQFEMHLDQTKLSYET